MSSTAAAIKVNIEHVSPGVLEPFIGNPRKNEHAINPVLRSIEQFGFINPIVVRKADNMIIAGHTRWKAALKAGMETVPVIYVDMTEDDARRFNVADNKLGELAEWDIDLLADLLKEWEEKGLDIGATGFSNEDISGILEMVEPTPAHTGKEDDIPLVPEVAITQTGDIWEMGLHRLICGDSTKPDVMARLTNGHPVDMVWTDPPYNVAYSSGKAGNGTATKPIENDNLNDTVFREFLTALFTNACKSTVPGGAIYITHSDSERENFQAAMTAAGFLYKQMLVWVKQQFVLGRQDYNWQHEPILYGWKAGAAHRWYGEFNKSTLIQRDPPLEPAKLTKSELVDILTELIAQVQIDVLDVNRPTRSPLHPTMKPVALVEKMILNSTRRRGSVLDPCGGSGTTLIACETTNRVCRTAELDPLYCDVIVKRWEEYTGNTAKRITNES